MMVQARVSLSSIYAERFIDIEKPIPQVQVATNLNIVKINEKREDMIELPFVFTANYTPPVAQVTIKGKTQVTGSKEELEHIRRSYDKKKPLPAFVQSISNVAFIEAVIVCRGLNIPPPLPLPKIPTDTKKKTSKSTSQA